MPIIRLLFRSSLGLIAAAVVVWSFWTVGVRAWQHRAETAKTPIHLTILHWGDPTEKKIVEDLIARYNQTHPDVRVTQICTGTFDSKLKTMMSAGTPPDLFYLPPRLLPELASLKLIRPVDDLVAAEKAGGKAGWMDDFFPILLNAFRYDITTGTVGKGQLYGLPKDFTTAVFYVNVDLFKAAGVPVPYQGWNWQQFDEACRKITGLAATPAYAGQTLYGSCFQLWPQTIRQLVWSFGGEFFATRPDGTTDFARPTLDSSKTLDALDFIARVRLTDKTVFNATGIAKDGGNEFFGGHIGSLGPVGRWYTPQMSSVPFKWDVVPVPRATPADVDQQMFITAWTMSSTTPYPKEAFEFMKFLCGPEGAAMQSRLGLAVPPLKSIANGPDFLAPPGIQPHNAQAFLDALKTGRIEQNPREAEWDRILGDGITKSIQLGLNTPAENVAEIQNAWAVELDSPLRKVKPRAMPWGMIAVVAIVGMGTAIGLGIFVALREKMGPLDRATQRAGYMFISPWIIGFLCLTAGPMLLSLLLSFTRWGALNSLDMADFVGLGNYHQLVTTDPTFYKSIWITVKYVLLAVPVSQVAALAVALLMNQAVKGIAVFRTIYFVPSVISGVALATLWLQIFNKDYGILNGVLGLLHLPTPDWFGRDAATAAIPAFVIMGLWGVGGGMIIYLAGLKGIPTSLYEAATIDGAGQIRRLWNITIPMLSPLLFYNLVMGLIGSFQIFTQVYVMTGAGPDNSTLVYVLNLYRQAFEFHNMGYASAMAWVLFVICLAVTIGVFRLGRSLVYYEGLK